jgi:hypothetical protein
MVVKTRADAADDAADVGDFSSNPIDSGFATGLPDTSAESSDDDNSCSSLESNHYDQDHDDLDDIFGCLADDEPATENLEARSTGGLVIITESPYYSTYAYCTLTRTGEQNQTAPGGDTTMPTTYYQDRLGMTPTLCVRLCVQSQLLPVQPSS